MNRRGEARARGAFATLLVAAGAVLLIGLAIQLLLGERTPALAPFDRIVLEAGAAVRVPAGWIVPVEARNPTDRAAARFHVVGELYEGDRRIEAAEAVIAVLPPGMRLRAALVFRSDPSNRRLALHARAPDQR
jgi:uncharacterized protein (TIGR02588 family)